MAQEERIVGQDWQTRRTHIIQVHDDNSMVRECQYDSMGPWKSGSRTLRSNLVLVLSTHLTESGGGGKEYKRSGIHCGASPDKLSVAEKERAAGAY